MNRPLVTVKALTNQARLERSVRIESGALITPAAQDWLRSATVPVQWLESTETMSAPRGPLLIAPQRHPICASLILMLTRRWPNLRLTSIDDRAGLLDAVIKACDLLAKCSKRRAVVLTDDMAVALCVANRFVSVRAAACDRPTGLMHLMRELSPNLLLLDPDEVSIRHLQGMIEQFAEGETIFDPVVELALTTAGEIASATGEIEESSKRCACAGR